MLMRSLCLLLALTALPAHPSPSQPPLSPPVEGDVIITLRAHDALNSALSLDSLKHAGSIVAGELILDLAGMAYGAFSPGKLSFAFRRDETAKLLHVEPATVPGVTTSSHIAPHPPLSIYHSLRLSRGKVFYDRPVGKTVRLKEAQELFGPLPPEGAQHIVPKAGHTYLLRTLDPKALGGREHFLKFLVLEATPDQVTLRIDHFRES